MKRIYVLLTLVLSVFLLAGCADKKVPNESIRVVYYKYIREAISDSKNPEIPTFETYSEGDLVTRPEDPVREAFDFVGWYKEPQHRNPWIFETDRVGNKTIMLYAKWTPKDWKVYLHVNGGELATQQIGKTDENGFFYGEVDSVNGLILHSPSREGYFFEGWYPYDEFDWTPSDGREPAKSFRPGETRVTKVDNVTQDLEFYAHWRPVRSLLTLNINYPGSGANPKPNYSTNMDYGSIYDFEKAGYDEIVDPNGEYKFIGWNTNKDGSGTWIEQGDIFESTRKITIYAIWTKI